MISVNVQTLLTIPIVSFAALSLMYSQTRELPARQNLPAESAKGDAGVLWRDPGDISALDLAAGPLGPDGAPKSPFRFQEEVGGGTSAKLLVQDDNGRTWELKWGEETRPEAFATRLLWAVGYLVEPAYFVGSGKIEGVGALGRAEAMINRGNGNSFTAARFELRDKDALIVPGPGWLFKDNPFVGTNELQGLKIMSMLVSNWDLKDPSSSDGSNTAIFRMRGPDGAPEKLLYVISDWGASMGKWGNIATRSKWDCKGYAGQNKDFVKGVRKGEVEFGYQGKRPELAKGITVENVRWLTRHLGQIKDDQLRAGLLASGASQEDAACFVPAIRDRIERLRAIAGADSRHTE